MMVRLRREHHEHDDAGGCREDASPAVDDGRVDPVDEQLVRELAERARAEGVSLTGPGGLLGRLANVVLESALDGEMDAHLGYCKHDPPGDGSGNSRNGRRAKTVLTGAGPMEGSGAPGPEWAAGCRWWWPKRWEC